MAKNIDKSQSEQIEVPAGYLTLKEAADLTKYTPDYIGQLVRSGKIEGKQVFSNVAWVTSESSLREYLERKGKDADVLAPVSGAKLPELLRPLLYTIIGFAAVFIIILAHILSVTIDRAISSSFEDKIEVTSKNL